jgi:hypothetical protein
MTDKKSKRIEPGASMAGTSIVSYFSNDPTLAQHLLNHGIEIRDIMLVPLLSGRGPLTIDQLAQISSVEEVDLQGSVNRLLAAGLVIKQSASIGSKPDTTVKLTGRGQAIANRIG